MTKNEDEDEDEDEDDDQDLKIGWGHKKKTFYQADEDADEDEDEDAALEEEQVRFLSDLILCYLFQLNPQKTKEAKELRRKKIAALRPEDFEDKIEDEESFGDRVSSTRATKSAKEVW